MIVKTKVAHEFLVSPSAKVERSRSAGIPDGVALEVFMCVCAKAHVVRLWPWGGGDPAPSTFTVGTQP